MSTKITKTEKTNFSTFPAISPNISLLLNTFFYESIVQRVKFRSGSIYCHLAWLLWPSFYFCCCCWLCVMEIATKTNWWHCSCCIGIWTNKTKHTKDCIRTEFIWIFLWESARYILCHLPWSRYYISNMAAHVLLLCISYKTTHISGNSTGNILIIYD